MRPTRTASGAVISLAFVLLICCSVDAGEAHLSAALREPQIASLSVEGVNARAEHDADSFIDALHDDKVVGASLKDLHFDIDLAIRQGKDPVAEYLESKRKVKFVADAVSSAKSSDTRTDMPTMPTSTPTMLGTYFVSTAPFAMPTVMPTAAGKPTAMPTAMPTYPKGHDPQVLLKARLHATASAKLMNGNRIEDGSWKYQSMKPSWWKGIFDKVDHVLECNNPDELDEGKGANMAVGRHTGEAPFHLIPKNHPGGAILVQVECDICQLLRGWQKHNKSVTSKFVLLGDMSQDSSMLKKNWPNFARWNDVEQEEHGCGYGHHDTISVDKLLTDDRVVLWVTAQQTYSAHPKILSLPLGVFHPTYLDTFMRNMTRAARPNTVAVTAVHGVPQRTMITKTLEQTLPDKYLVKIPSPPKGYEPKDVGLFIHDTHGKLVRPKAAPHNGFTWYWNFTAQSQFVLSPPGTGFDCYRHWEALAMGAIPIIEHTTFDRTFAGLPVLLVDDYKDVSVDLLERTRQEFWNKPWQWERLTSEYWDKLVQGVLETGSSATVQVNHPIHPKYAGEYQPKTGWYGA